MNLMKKIKDRIKLFIIGIIIFYIILVIGLALNCYDIEINEKKIK